MLKRIISILFLLIIGSCVKVKTSSTPKLNSKPILIVQQDTIERFIDSISIKNLQTHLKYLSSDNLKGRKTGEPGHWESLEYISNYYKSKQIKSFDSTYYQFIPEKYLPRKVDSTANVIAFIKGKTKPEEFVIVSGHSDHLGIKKREIYNGADDNASGTSAIMEIARLFKMAENKGIKSKRSVVFCHFTAEEIGKGGSKFFVENETVPIKNMIADINIDMIGRVDNRHENGDYIYIIGADRVSLDFEITIKSVNETFTGLNLDESYDAPNDPNRYFYRSDQFHFAKQNIPVVFFFSGTHKDYHRPSDTEDKIDYNTLRRRTQLIFATTWQLANQPESFKLD